MKRMDQQPVVLLMEADALIGADLSDALEGAGYRVLGPFATAVEALGTIERDAPNLAVLDIILQDGPSTAILKALRRRGVPFLVHSSCRPDDPVAAAFLDVPWLSKPALPWDVVTLCDELHLAASSASPEAGNAATGGSARPTSRTVESTNPLVRKLAGFSDLSDRERSLLQQISANSWFVPPHTDLVQEGDPPVGVFLVMEGFACRHKLRANGQRQIVAHLLPGDLCDIDVALLDKMDHTLSTLSACRVVRIAPEAVAELMQRHPRIARALRINTLVDEATLREWLVNVGQRTAEERLAHLFCELLLRLQVVGLVTADSYKLPITQVDLADTTGMSSVHVSRSLQSLRRQGLIGLHGGRLTILDMPRLWALAEFKANYLHLQDRAA